MNTYRTVVWVILGFMLLFLAALASLFVLYMYGVPKPWSVFHYEAVSGTQQQPSDETMSTDFRILIEASNETNYSGEAPFQIVIYAWSSNSINDWFIKDIQLLDQSQVIIREPILDKDANMDIFSGPTTHNGLAWYRAGKWVSGFRYQLDQSQEVVTVKILLFYDGKEVELQRHFDAEVRSGLFRSRHI